MVSTLGVDVCVSKQFGVTVKSSLTLVVTFLLALKLTPADWTCISQYHHHHRIQIDTEEFFSFANIHCSALLFCPVAVLSHKMLPATVALAATTLSSHDAVPLMGALRFLDMLLNPRGDAGKTPKVASGFYVCVVVDVIPCCVLCALFWCFSGEMNLCLVLRCQVLWVQEDTHAHR